MADVRHWDDVSEGMALAPIDFPLTVHRLVLEAGGNRDFATVHHNGEAARATGAPDCFANNVLIQGMFERITRDFIGVQGVLRKIGPFRMHSFLLPGHVARVSGAVKRKWLGEAGEGLIDLFVKVESNGQVTASGTVVARLPRGRA